VAAHGFLKTKATTNQNVELLRELGAKSSVGSVRRSIRALIRAVEAPEPQVAIITAIGPNERKSEPDALDNSFPFGSPHGTAGADGALTDFFAKSQMHGNQLPFVFVNTIMMRAHPCGRMEPRRCALLISCPFEQWFPKALYEADIKAP
jgi:hypothetical protein